MRPRLELYLNVRRYRGAPPVCFHAYWLLRSHSRRSYASREPTVFSHATRLSNCRVRFFSAFFLQVFPANDPSLRMYLRALIKPVILSGFLFASCAWLGSELVYSSRICPTRVRTVADHLQRFGEPQSVHEVRHEGGTFYEFTGSTDSLFALPSSPPAYIYNSQGRLVAWCRDPGDQPEFEQVWRRTSTPPLDKEVIRRLVAAQ